MDNGTARPVVDAHAHFTPRALVSRLQHSPGAFPHVALNELGADRYSFTFPDTPPTRPMQPRLWDVPAALEWLDRQDIDVHVTGAWADVFGYTLPADEGADWCRLINEETLAELAGETRVLPLASVPIQSGRHAVQELETARHMGFRGLTIGTFAPGVELDHPDLDGLWETAAGLRMPIVLHPLYLYGEPRLASYDLPNAIGRVNDTAIAVARLLYAGVPTRHPDLQMIVVHGGGGVPYAIGRLARNYELNPGGGMADPREGFRRLYFDSVVYDPAPLRYLVELAGADRVLLGSDYPFPILDPEPRRVVREAGFAPATSDAILSGNACRVFGLETGDRPSVSRVSPELC
jgi:aminocarboxymuconate-semialdehyde decarboxylase